MSTYSLDSLAAVIAQIVHFAHDDYEQSGFLPEEVTWNIAYVVACFTAQHATLGKDGVHTEAALVGMKIAERMSYDERLRLAHLYVLTWSV